MSPARLQLARVLRVQEAVATDKSLPLVDERLIGWFTQREHAKQEILQETANTNGTLTLWP